MAKMRILFKNQQIKSDLKRWFEESDLDEDQLVAAAVPAIEDWLDEDAVEFEPDGGLVPYSLANFLIPHEK